MKIILDTNIYFSAFIFDRDALNLMDWCYDNYLVYVSKDSISELTEVLLREKTQKFIKNYEISKTEKFIQEIIDRSLVIEQTNTVAICRDPRDNKFLEIAQEISADYLITGDNDLLILNQFESTKILKPKEFIKEFKLSF